MTQTGDSRFLSCEDLDLRRLSAEEFSRLSHAALVAAQATNHLDEHIYRFGCIAVEPGYEHLLPSLRNGTL